MISRRRFSEALAGTLFGASGAGTSRLILAEEIKSLVGLKDVIVGGGQYLDIANNERNFVLSLTTPERPPFGLIALDFFPHGVAIRPDNPTQLLVMEKKGPGCSLVDIESQAVIKNISASPGCWFYGHGVYSLDSSRIFIVETELDSGNGLLSVRDANTGQIIGQLDTYGANPHDCRLIDGGKVLAVTNAGLSENSISPLARPCVTYIDLLSGDLLERIPLTNVEINAGHLLVTDKMDLAVVSAPREGRATDELGGLSLRPAGSDMLSITAPSAIVDQLFGETLSIAYHPSTDMIAATTPDANLVTFWKMKEQKFLSAVRLPRPRGICLAQNQASFIVSGGERPTLYSIDAADVSNVRASGQQSYISGSHVVNWSLEIS